MVLVSLPVPVDAATLSSLSVTPSNPTLQIGQNQTFTVTGTFDDGTTRPLTPSIPLAVGERHACAVLADDTVRCWGNNGNGQLGNGTLTTSSTPAAVNDVSTATGVAAGVLHTCARLADGVVRCWGYNGDGQLGNGTLTNSSTPVTASGLSTATAVAVGAFHSCAVLADRTVRCWGQNVTGQLGNGTTTDSSTPVVVGGLNTITAITTGYYHTCALLAGGSVRCWGYNGNGQLGNGTFTNSSTPVVVAALSPAIGISAGAFHTCAVLADGSIRCWGFNGNGQLGNGSLTGSAFPTPVVPTDTSPARAVGAGAFHTCAVMADGSAQCWGYNGTGQLGNGTATNSSTPVVVSGLSNGAEIAGGYYHTCALLADGSARCWGNNGTGQLGTGTLTSSTTPVTVNGISSAAVLEWSSSAPSVARSDPNGVVTALAAGIAIVTARLQSLSGGTTITVPPPGSRLINISTRAFVAVGSNAGVGGLIISGTGTKQVLLRGFGPTLSSFGITGALANPTMDLYWDDDNNPNTAAILVLTNDDWGTALTSCPAPVVVCGTPTDIANTRMSADSYAPTNPNRNLDASLLLTLPPGTYTARLSGVSGGTGVGLIGVDDVDANQTTTLINISTRAFVGTGANVEVGGFIIGGTGNKQLLLRGFGPTLSSFGITGALANPTLDLYWDDDNNPNTATILVLTNNDWGTALGACPAPVVLCGTPTDIENTGMSANSYAPSNPNRALDAALLLTLPPGTYTARLSGVSGGTGVGLIGMDQVGP